MQLGLTAPIEMVVKSRSLCVSKTCVPNQGPHVLMCFETVRFPCIISDTAYNFIHNAKWRSDELLEAMNLT